MFTDIFKEPNTPLSGPVSHVDDSPSPVGSSFDYNFMRLEIQLRMGEHAYQQQRPTHMSVESTSSEGGPSTTIASTVAYTTQDHPASYASVSINIPCPCLSAEPEPVTHTIYKVAGFSSYPMSYDSSSLPTPVSVAGSPPMTERTSARMVHSYSHNGSNSQQPTPPGTSRPNPSDWFDTQNHQMMSSSQSSSPMTMHTSSADMLEMHGLETTQSPENHVIAVATTEPQLYFGRYGVSEQQGDLSPPMGSHPMFGNHAHAHVDPSALLKNSMMSSSSMPLANLAPAPPRVPTLQPQPNPGTLGRVMTPIEDLHHPFGMQNHLPMFEMQPAYNNTKRPSKARSKRGESKKRHRGGARTALPNRTNPPEPRRASPPGSTSPGHKSLVDQCQPATLQLNDKAPEQDRFLFDLKAELVCYKGKDMWERIDSKWTERYDKKDRAALQMQLARSVAKFAIWPEYEVSHIMLLVSSWPRLIRN
jgi:hypothetical protein